MVLGFTLKMSRLAFKIWALFVQENSKQRFSIAVVKKHVPLIRFRAQQKRASGQCCLQLCLSVRPFEMFYVCWHTHIYLRSLLCF